MYHYAYCGLYLDEDHKVIRDCCGHYYFDAEVENPEMFLAYPSHSDFRLAIPHSFDFPIQGEKTLKLWGVPFVISDKDLEKGIKWPDEAKIPVELY